MSANLAEIPLAAHVRSSGWAPICELTDLLPNIGVCVLVNGRQIAIFRIGEALYALDNFDPASGANVLSRGIVGDLKGECVVASPLYKHHYSLVTGRCLEDLDTLRRVFVASNNGSMPH